VARRDRGEAPLWDSIHRTEGWDVVHCYGTSLEGWMVLVCRRHVSAVADLTDAEAAELGPLIKLVSAAVHEAVGCVKTYVAQFAEHPLHPHVHVHVIPRRSDMAHDERGPRVFARLGVTDDLAVPESRMDVIAARVAQHLRPALD
jgi:diadenosine tetraphosphate (Ap4A) HIT family hydrolase